MLYQRELHKTLHANACWRSYCRSSSHKRETIMLYNSVFVFDAAIISFIIGIGPRSTQRILDSHRKMIGHNLSYIYTHTRARARVRTHTHRYTHNSVFFFIEHTCNHIRTPIKKNERKTKKHFRLMLSQ